MLFYTFLMVAVILIPIFIGIDFVVKRKPKGTQDDEINTDPSLPDSFVYFLPFASLYYSTPFWSNLAMLTGVVIYGGLALMVANRKNRLGSKIEMFAINTIGSLIVTILGYYIFIHEGVLSNEVAAHKTTALSNNWLSYWPYALYALVIILFLPKLGAKKTDPTYKLFFMIIAFNLLPLFTQYYWWGLALGFIVFLLISKIVIEKVDMTAKGGISFVLSYVYMMAAMASIIAYAVLF